MMTSTDEDFLMAETKDKEREDLLKEALLEIELFNLKLKDPVDGIKNVTIPEENINNVAENNNKEFGFSSGIIFFDKKNFECRFTAETVVQDFLKIDFKFVAPLEKDSSINQILDYFIKHCHSGYTWHRHTFKAVVKFCFQLFGTCQSYDSLDKIMQCLMMALNNQKYSAFKWIGILLPSVIQNLGGIIEDDENELTMETSKLSLNLKPENPSIDLVLNFKYILIALGKVFSVKLQFQSNSENLVKEYDKIFLLIFKAAQDPYILSSSIMYYAKICMQLILEMYPENFPDLVQDIVINMYDYWDSKSPVFDHSLVCHVLADLIPTSDRGQSLRSSLALLSISCCLDTDEGEVFDYVSILKLADFCIERKSDIVKLQNIPMTYSILLMIDAAIRRPLVDGSERKHLSRILEFVATIQVAISSELENKKKMDCLVKVLNSSWSKLLETNDRPMRQRKLEECFTKESKLY